mmetsp:Transcript_10793/g.42135  ORF Transcript_10793/g.42135 Transcript_10793/m.42135 type:complete len:280 (-) Transcript_10793:2601-3440(-)
MMENLERTLPSRTQRYCRFPRYSTCAERNASSAASARPGTCSRSSSRSLCCSGVSPRMPPGDWPPRARGASARKDGPITAGVSSPSSPPWKMAGVLPFVGDGFAIHGTEGDEKFSGDLAYCMSMASTDACAASTASVAVCRSFSIAAVDSGGGPVAVGGNGNGFTGETIPGTVSGTGRSGGVGAACSTVTTDGDTVADAEVGRTGDGAVDWRGGSSGAGNGDLGTGEEGIGAGGAGAEAPPRGTSPTSLGGSMGAALAVVTATAALLAACTAASSAISA